MYANTFNIVLILSLASLLLVSTAWASDSSRYGKIVFSRSDNVTHEKGRVHHQSKHFGGHYYRPERYHDHYHFDQRRPIRPIARPISWIIKKHYGFDRHPYRRPHEHTHYHYHGAYRPHKPHHHGHRPHGFGYHNGSYHHHHGHNCRY